MKLKEFASDIINVAHITMSIFETVENIVGKGENASYQHFAPFPTMFSKVPFLGGHYNSGLCGKDLNTPKFYETLIQKVKGEYCRIHTRVSVDIIDLPCILFFTEIPCAQCNSLLNTDSCYPTMLTQQCLLKT